MPQPSVPVLEAHRLQAWQWLHQPCWPATLAETVGDPIRARLIEIYAGQCARAEARCLHSPQARPARRAPAAPPTPQRRCTDLKRAAAGDRDDD